MADSKPKGIRKVLADAFSSQSGDYDPARLAGYSYVALAGLAFLIMWVWIVIKTGDLHVPEFTQGMAVVGGLIVTAAGGVLMKAKTENPVDYQQKLHVMDQAIQNDTPAATQEAAKPPTVR